MKKLLLSLLYILLFVGVANAGQKENEIIRAVVVKWQNIHNNKDINAFKKLYGSTILFYGRYKDLDALILNKQKFLAKDAYQEIISPIEISFYTSGTIKCDFTKKVTYNNEKKEYPSYLLLQKIDGQYLITGESDAITDQRLHVDLNIGKKIGTTVNKSAVIFIVIISILFGAGLFYFIKKRRDTLIANRQPLDGALYKRPIPIIIEEEINTEIANKKDKEKGDTFEKHVISRFPEQYYKIKIWQGDKYHEGRFAESNYHPDLIMELNTKNNKASFAAECKYRQTFFKGEIKLAKEYQIINYRKYATEFNQLVFIVLGVGGEPSNPDSLYIIPLNEINSTTYTENQLKKYLKYGKGDFFYNPQLQTLG